MTVAPGDETPVGIAEFDDLMDRLGPFGSRPRLAVAVSGGPDSMALLLLVHEWARRKGGETTALTVDHRLRSDSAAEAARVGAWCADRGIGHAILVREGDVPASRLQERARTARYDLLTAWCRARGAAYLLTGHQMDDQAETFLHRLGRGSGVAGLAGMPAAATVDGVRVLRPLLGLRRTRLVATCAARGQAVIEDPSNRDRRFARVVLRERIAELERSGIGVPAIAGAAAVLAKARAREEGRVADLAAACTTVYPEGYGEIDAAPFEDAPAEIASFVLGRLLVMVGGAAYPPRRAHLERLANSLRAQVGGTRTLGGCIVRRDGDRIRVMREYRRIAHRVPLSAEYDVLWDGRFRVSCSGCAAAANVEIGALGAHGWQEIAREVDEAYREIPGPARFALPALWRRDKVICVPHLAYRDEPNSAKSPVSAHFAPRNRFCGAPFWVV